MLSARRLNESERQAHNRIAQGAAVNLNLVSMSVGLADDPAAGDALSFDRRSTAGARRHHNVARLLRQPSVGRARVGVVVPARSGGPLVGAAALVMPASLPEQAPERGFGHVHR